MQDMNFAVINFRRAARVNNRQRDELFSKENH